MCAGILTILSAVATAFYTIMLMQTKSATRFADSVRAEFLARGGVSYAVARLRESAYSKTEDPNAAWFTVNYMNGLKRGISFPADLSANGIDDDGDGRIDNPEEKTMPYSAALGNSTGASSDRFVLEIADASSRINVNACDNLGVVLDNLCRVIGPPLVAADPKLLLPGRWAAEGGPAVYGSNPDDQAANLGAAGFTDIYYKLYNTAGSPTGDKSGRPKTDLSGRPVYGDGYAIAGYRARFGRFNNIEDVKIAIPYVSRPAHPELEMLEREVKFAALRDYITIDSWVDTNTVCVGKFEWVYDSSGGNAIAVDRDKSWVSDDPLGDPANTRGSLRGSYVSIMNGHGAGQLRRIKTNGIDWIEVENGFVVKPGPISSYMIIAKEDALLDTLPSVSPPTQVPRTSADGTLVDDPDIDYALHPLCIHRAPVNLNTASDKLLAALFLGINVQHGHPMAIGTNADKTLLGWKVGDPNQMESYLLTTKGLKRLPATSGEIVFDRAMPTAQPQFAYLNNYGLLDPNGSTNITEAHELAYRILIARQEDTSFPYSDPATGNPSVNPAHPKRGPFRSWDDLYFRVVKPWDDARLSPVNPDASKKISVARMIMAHFNSNTDILKFNPNIEWIDRWGRNFTEMEPVMIFNGGATPTTPIWVPGDETHMWDYNGVIRQGLPKGAYYTRSLRYKSDELIDKTDMNRSTTEFSFDSGGIFAIESTGVVVRRGEVLSERKIEALVKVYDVWRESTQRQFVQGTFSKASGTPGTNNSGQVARDADPANDGKPGTWRALNTLPEPLVPLGYRINNANGLTDVVGGIGDAWGNAKNPNVPDVVANRILPAGYDGQIVLATNTQNFSSDGGTFLASFNGDLDTDTSAGNGREQSKTPKNRNVRVLDTIGLLGLLNDAQVDFDPMETDPDKAGKKLAHADFATFPTDIASQVMSPLDPKNYWENVTCRMGDLRNDGVFLGNVGCSGKDATIKYLVEKNWALKTSLKGTVAMWFKPTWHGTDHREHEFFNADNRGGGFGARYNSLVKYGRYSWCIPTGGGGDDTVACSGGPHVSDNDLCANFEDKNDSDVKSYLHGGTRNVPGTVRESPAFHTQPFRWSFVGGRFDYTQAGSSAPEYCGYWVDETGNASRDVVIKNVCRPFIDTQRDPEGATWKSQYFWKQMNVDTLATPPDIGAPTNNSFTQAAAWSWADGGSSDANAVFGANNLNEKKGMWIYRASPIDGTNAVIDEYKLSSTLWSSDTINKYQTTSRYYLPQNPAAPEQCPTYTSQTLLQSIRGFHNTDPVKLEAVDVVRVSWNVFTPRFLYENIVPVATRKEIVHGDTKPQGTSVTFRGPFDYIQYNFDVLKGMPDPHPNEADVNVPKTDLSGRCFPFSADRPAPMYYAAQPQATRGVEIELLNDQYPTATSVPLAGKTFTDPSGQNALTADPRTPIRVRTDRLRYRVRFRYPVDQLVENGVGIQDEKGRRTIDPAKHYLLDTPVFDDISITYFSKPRLLSCRDVTE